MENEQKPDIDSDLPKENQPIPAHQIIEGMAKGTIKAEDVSTAMRRDCIAWLRYNSGITMTDMAAMFNVTISCISKDVSKIEKATLKHYAATPGKIISKFFAGAARLRELALKQGDLWLAWKIEVDTIKEAGRLRLVAYDEKNPINMIFGDQINAGGKKLEVNGGTGREAEQKSIGYDLTGAEREQLDYVLAQSISRRNAEVARALQSEEQFINLDSEESNDQKGSV